jgi:hypothetical protein
MSVRDDKAFVGAHNVNSARFASSVFSSPIFRLKQQPFTLLVDGNNLTIRPNADDALQFQWYPPSSPNDQPVPERLMVSLRMIMGNEFINGLPQCIFTKEDHLL